MSTAIEGVVILILAGTAALVIALAVKAFRGLRQAGGREEDTRLVQDVYRGLDRLERRIEALETILSEKRQGGRSE